MRELPEGRHSLKPARVQIQLFKLNRVGGERSVSSLLRLIEADDIGDRVRYVRGANVRLEKVERRDAENGLPRRWALDFVKLRDVSGPGKGSKDQPIEDLDIKEEQFFGEEAAALYLPQTRHLIAQYNHYGVRPSAMAQYLSSYLEDETNEYEADVVLDPDAEARYERITEVRRFSVGVDLDKLTARQRRDGHALTQALGQAADMNGARIKIEVSVGHDKDRSIRKAKGWLSRLVNSGAADSAVIAGRETPDGDICPVDLINETLKHHVTIEPGSGKRLPMEERFRKLEATYRRWRERIQNG